MTDRGHVAPNLMVPPRLKLTCNQAYRAEVLLKAPVGRGVPAALPAHDRHFLPMAGIAADWRKKLARGRVKSAPGERQIFSLERSRAAVVGEEFGQTSMRGVSLGDDKKPGRVLV